MESSNNKAMHDALVEIDELTNLLDIPEDKKNRLISPSHSFVAVKIRKIIKKALEEPPRNCERFETAEDAKKEFNYLWNFVWKRGGGYVDERAYRSEYEKWLFSPIQEGDTNGSR